MYPTLYCYKRMPIWHADTLPEAFQQPHNTKAGTWAKLTIFSGSLAFYELNDDHSVRTQTIFTPSSDIPFVAPQAWHRVAPLSDELCCQLSFYCTAEDYVAKKYQLTATHSEVVAAQPHLVRGSVLDLGCGSGRNAVYLALLGHSITAVDCNHEALDALSQLAASDHLPITCRQYDINTAAIANLGTALYDTVLATVVLQFCQSERIPTIIADLQEYTASGGTHIIVAPMHTEEAPCPLDFPHTFASGELRQTYQEWHLLRYNEDFGHLHVRDNNGNRLRMRFATLIAKKP